LIGQRPGANEPITAFACFQVECIDVISERKNNF
jgi:hypothetical protein